MDFVTKRNAENRKLTNDINLLNNNNDEKSELIDFYSGAKVFITGGTGN